jgi:hypothetical protein
MQQSIKWVDRGYHKIPRLETAFVKLTCDADIGVSRGAGLPGCTINFGTDFIASARFDAEGVLTIVAKVPVRDLVGLSICQSSNRTRANYTSIVPATGTLVITFELFADGTTDTDPDGAVIFIRLDGNACGVSPR